MSRVLELTGEGETLRGPGSSFVAHLAAHTHTDDSAQQQQQQQKSRGRTGAERWTSTSDPFFILFLATFLKKKFMIWIPYRRRGSVSLFSFSQGLGTTWRLYASRRPGTKATTGGAWFSLFRSPTVRVCVCINYPKLPSWTTCVPLPHLCVCARACPAVQWYFHFRQVRNWCYIAPALFY